MQAIQVREFGSPEVLRVGEVADPIPGEGQLLIRVHAAGVNPVDAYIRTGTYSRKPPLPYTPGSDGAGVVVSAGPGVTGITPGQRVYTSGSVTGTYAELAVCGAADVHPLPERISYEQGAGVFVPYATAFRALFSRAQAQPGETVLVHGGTGGVGVASVQLARQRGLTILATGGTPEGREMLRNQGAHHVLNHRETGYEEEILALTHGRGVDVIVEMLANVNLAKDLSLLAPGGRVAVVGNRGTIEINPREAMAREAAILGVMLFAASTREMAGIHQALIAGMESGSLSPVVGRRFSLAEAPLSHETVMLPGAYGKIVLTI